MAAYLHYGYRPWGGVVLPAIITADKTTRRAELASLSKPELIEQGVTILKRALSCRETADHVVPLSGGHDSRGVLAGLVDTIGPSQVRTVTFGTPGTLDFELGRSIAKAAGVRWEGIDLRTLPWKTSDLVAVARSYARPHSIFAIYPHAQIRRCLRPESIVWSGSVGVSVGATYYVFQDPSTTWAQARQRFASGEARLRALPLTPPGFDPESVLPQAPLCGESSLLYDDQLNLFARHACSFMPSLDINGQDFRVPYLDPDWVMFVLSMPHHYRYQKLYAQVLARAFPTLLSLPTKKNRGLPMSASPWRVKLRRQLIKLWKAPRRLIPAWPWGTDPVLNYLDYEQLSRTKQDFRSMIDENIHDLARRKLIHWLDVEQIWRRHRRGIANHTDAVMQLASLELLLKAQEQR